MPSAIVPPQNLEAEESVIGALLLSATAIGAGSGVAVTVSGRSDTLKKVSTSDLTYRLTALAGMDIGTATPRARSLAWTTPS